jgi:hypothetical protein
MTAVGRKPEAPIAELDPEDFHFGLFGWAVFFVRYLMTRQLSRYAYLVMPVSESLLL